MEFSNNQKHFLLKKMGYDGPASVDEMDAFIQSNPGVKARMGKFTRAFADGGLAVSRSAYVPPVPSAPVPAVGTTPKAPTPNPPTKKIPRKKKKAGAKKKLTSAQREMLMKAYRRPQALTTRAAVKKVTKTPYQFIGQKRGQLKGPAPVSPTATVKKTAQAGLPKAIEAETYKPTLSYEDMARMLQRQPTAAQGELSPEAVMQAAQGEVSKEATVQGQMEELMKGFAGGETPAWAAGAMRAATGQMAARGLGASSMAGAAVTQAAMESALPIAFQDAQTWAQMDMANLNNRQQAAVRNADAYFQMDMKNLDNEQQGLMLKTQSRVQSLLSDQAAKNAAKQFNASSENQVNQFYASLTADVEKFNTNQKNTIKQFNAGQTNAMSQFYDSLRSQRQQFNATNSLIVAQANTQWRQQMALTNTAAQNNANMERAKMTNALTAASLDQIWQRERDLMSFAFQSGENDADRALSLLLADKDAANIRKQLRAGKKSDTMGALGYLAGKLLDKWDYF